MKPFIHYITQIYTDSDHERNKELNEAVRNQITNSLILSSSILSIDTLSSFSTIPIDHRPTFSELVSYEKTDENVVNLLTNTDCYIENEHVQLLSKIKPGVVWCLSRYKEYFNYSQDAWLWRGHLDISNCDYYMGLLGCDNNFAFECAMSGRRLKNPCFSIKLNHIHKSKIRHWTNKTRINHPYLYVNPTRIEQHSTLCFIGDDFDYDRVKKATGIKNLKRQFYD